MGGEAAHTPHLPLFIEKLQKLAGFLMLPVYCDKMGALPKILYSFFFLKSTILRKLVQSEGEETSDVIHASLAKHPLGRTFCRLF